MVKGKRETFYNVGLGQKRIQGIFDATWELIGQVLFPLAPLTVAQFVCFIDAVFRPKGKKPAGHYIPASSSSLRLRRSEQRRIIYAPRGRVHKAQIF